MSLLSRVPGYVRALVRHRRGDVSVPRMLTYTVTFRCNARCIMCDSWKKESDDDLTLEQETSQRVPV